MAFYGGKGVRFHRWIGLIAGALAVMAAPALANAHEGGGFHPEKLWALLKTALLVAAIIIGAIGALWYYERRRSRQRKSN